MMKLRARKLGGKDLVYLFGLFYAKDVDLLLDSVHEMTITANVQGMMSAVFS